MTVENTPKVSSIEFARILRLPQETVLLGLSVIIVNEISELRDRSPITNEELWLIDLYSAVDSIIDHGEHPEILTDPEKYKEAISKVLTYLKFLGVDESLLTAQVIANKEQIYTKDFERRLDELEKSGFPPQILNTDLINQKLEEINQPNREGVLKTISDLELLVELYTRVPTFARFSRSMQKLESSILRQKK